MFLILIKFELKFPGALLPCQLLGEGAEGLGSDLRLFL